MNDLMETHACMHIHTRKQDRQMDRQLLKWHCNCSTSDSSGAFPSY